MWTTTYEKPKKFVRIYGVWVDTSAVIAVRDVDTGVRVFLSSGSEIDIKGRVETPAERKQLNASDFIKFMSEAARDPNS